MNEVLTAVQEKGTDTLLQCHSSLLLIHDTLSVKLSVCTTYMYAYIYFLITFSPTDSPRLCGSNMISQSLILSDFSLLDLSFFLLFICINHFANGYEIYYF